MHPRTSRFVLLAVFCASALTATVTPAQAHDDPQNQPPLTLKQKYVLAFHQTVDFSAHIGNLFQAALQQSVNAQPHYGQGWGPYAERFGAAEGDQATSAFFTFGFLPSILHDDPRFF